MGERVCGDQRNICTKLVPLHKPKYPQTISNKRRLENNIFFTLKYLLNEKGTNLVFILYLLMNDSNNIIVY